MIRATVLTLCLILLPTSLTAQTVPQAAPQTDNPGKTAMLAVLGDVVQKILSCTQAGDAANAAMQQGKAGAEKSAIDARDHCLTEQRDIAALKTPAAVPANLRAESDLLLSQTCPDAVGGLAHILDLVAQGSGDSNASPAVKQEAKDAGYNLGHCLFVIDAMAIKSGATAVEGAALIAPLLKD